MDRTARVVESNPFAQRLGMRGRVGDRDRRSTELVVHGAVVPSSDRASGARGFGHVSDVASFGCAFDVASIGRTIGARGFGRVGEHDRRSSTELMVHDAGARSVGRVSGAQGFDRATDAQGFGRATAVASSGRARDTSCIGRVRRGGGSDHERGPPIPGDGSDAGPDYEGGPPSHGAGSDAGSDYEGGQPSPGAGTRDLPTRVADLSPGDLAIRIAHDNAHFEMCQARVAEASAALDAWKRLARKAQKSLDKHTAVQLQRST